MPKRFPFDPALRERIVTNLAELERQQGRTFSEKECTLKASNASAVLPRIGFVLFSAEYCPGGEQ